MAEPRVHGSVGWDAWAEEYARLPETNVAYRFSKRLLYDVVDSEIDGRAGLDILDFNCGCGNDFAYFLQAGHHLVGCDGSAGMLAVAARRHAAHVASGAVALFEGRAEELAADAFGRRRFDLIFSATGGVAYLSDHQLADLHRTFWALLKPGGRMIVTHLLPRCMIESAYYVWRCRPRAALRRWRSQVDVYVKSERLVMQLRSVRRLRRILDGVAPPRSAGAPERRHAALSDGSSPPDLRRGGPAPMRARPAGGALELGRSRPGGLDQPRTPRDQRASLGTTVSATGLSTPGAGGSLYRVAVASIVMTWCFSDDH